MIKEYLLIKDLGKGRYRIIDNINCENLKVAKEMFSDKFDEDCFISRMVYYKK